MNRIVLVGRAVKDAELRYTAAGTAVTRFRLAVDRPYAGPNGEREADFVDVVCWRKLAESVGTYVRKGRLVGVDGRLQLRSYEDPQGVRRTAAEVVADTVTFLDAPPPAEPEPPWPDEAPNSHPPNGSGEGNATSAGA